MAKLEERLRRELERIAQPADPAGVTERVLRRVGRAEALQRVKAGALAAAVVASSIAGFYGLSRVFGEGSRPDATAPPASNGLIVYQRLGDPDRGDHLFLVNPDGTGTRQLTHGAVMDMWPAWSPDGTHLAFSRWNLENMTIRLAVMEVVTGEIRLITPPEMSVARPDWSPDGKRIAFSGFGEGVESGIYVVSSDGSGMTRITDEQFFSPDNPQWSPDGSTIAFSTNLDGHTQGSYVPGSDVYVIAPDGTDLRNVTNTPDEGSSEGAIGWRPDGDALLIGRGPATLGPGQPTQTYEWLWVSLDGDRIDRVLSGTYESENYQEPSMSPDGRYVVFSAGLDGHENIWFMDLETGELTQVTTGGTFVRPAWQPIPIGSAVEQNPTPGETSPVATAEPTPVLKGIGPVCNLSVVEGDFVGDGGVDTAFVYSEMPDVGGCQPPENGFQSLGVSDGTGDAVLTYGPLECEPACRAFAAPDVDQDGTSEILVVQVGFSILGLGLYDVGPAGGPGADGLVVLPVEIAPPGDPAGGFDAGEEVRFWLGGDAFELDALTCENGPDRRVLVATTAIQRPPDSPDSAWKAHETTFELRPGGELNVVGARDFEEPVTMDAPSFASGEELCGAPLGP